MTSMKRNAPKLLLGLLVLLFIANPVVKTLEMPGLGYAIDGILVGCLLMALYAEHETFSWKRPGVWAVLLAFALRLIATHWNPSHSLEAYRAFLICTEIYTAAVILQIGLALIKVLTRGGRVQANTVTGVAAVYILIAIAFGSLHIATFAWQEDKAFNGFEHNIARDLDGGESTIGKWGPELMYYSVVTQTTLGYGDITPKSDLARGVAMAQTVIGQLFLAIILARIIGMELAQKQAGDLD